MVAPSKIFEHPLCFNHCSQSILHPGIGCLRSFLNDFAKYSVGGLKYFSPLLITPIVLKWKTMNRDLFAAAVKYYLDTVFWTTLAASSSFFCICCFRNSLGRFLPYTTLFVPTVMGMQFCWFFPAKVMKLFSTATSQSVLESLLRQYVNPVTRILLHSTPLQTLLFMINSAIILHYKRLKVYKDFWFMQPYEGVEIKLPPAKGMDVNANYIHYERAAAKCVHGDSIKCSKFVWDGIRSYLCYGIALDLLTTIMKGGVPKGSQGVLQMAWHKLKRFRPNMTGFFIFYSGIYRLSSCLLRKYYGHLSDNLQHVMAAFLGGSSYLLVDKVSFFTLSTVIAAQILWQQFCNLPQEDVKTKHNSQKRSPNLALKLIREVPFSRVFFSLNMGYLVHNFIMNYEVLNSFTRGFLDSLTSNKTKHIRDAVIKPTMEELIKTAKMHSVKILL